MFRTLACISLVAMTAFAAAGCQVEAPRSPVAGLSVVDPPQPPDLGKYPGRAEVDVLYVFKMGGVKDKCGGPDPFFRFDTKTPKDRSTPTLQVLANCMTSGALSGRSIRLIGRTDPRGTVAYNEKLGLDRAMTVKNYLIHQGVDEGRILVASTGEEVASADPAAWRTDRRVDVELVQ